MNYGFIKVAAAMPVVKVADCKANSSEICKLISKAESNGVQLVSFPELCLTAYTCGDLFHSSTLQNGALHYLEEIIDNTRSLNIISIVGLPINVNDKLYNCAVVLSKGSIIGVVPKKYRPNYNEFYEVRWFASSTENSANEIEICGQTVPFGEDILFNNNDLTFSIEICEDVWMPVPPSSFQALAGSQLIFNPSASNELIGKNDYRRQLISQQSARCIAGYIYASSGFGESSTDLLFAGSSFIAENGSILAESNRFLLENQLIISEIDIERLRHDRQKNTGFMQGLSPLNTNIKFRKIPFELPHITNFELTRHIDSTPFVPNGPALDERCREISNIQANALAVRLHHTGIKNVVLGISGGLDSTLALLVCVQAFDRLGINRKQIYGVTMPGFGTTDRTHNNAVLLMEKLGVTSLEIGISNAVNLHFEDIGQNPDNHNITYENSQARERTQILMDLANKYNGMVIGTGDLSELALGWATYNGDHMSMYAVNTSIPKTLVKHLVKWTSDHALDNASKVVLDDILDTPISPELLPPAKNGEILQRTEDVVGPYELHDFFLYYTLRFGFSPKKIEFLAKRAFVKTYDGATINKWLKVFIHRFFTQQFKRSCLPDGPKVGSVNLSPRGDWRMPSDASESLWQENISNE